MDVSNMVDFQHRSLPCATISDRILAKKLKSPPLKYRLNENQRKNVFIPTIEHKKLSTAFYLKRFLSTSNHHTHTHKHCSHSFSLDDIWFYYYWTHMSLIQTCTHRSTSCSFHCFCLFFFSWHMAGYYKPLNFKINPRVVKALAGKWVFTLLTGGEPRWQIMQHSWTQPAFWWCEDWEPKAISDRRRLETSTCGFGRAGSCVMDEYSNQQLSHAAAFFCLSCDRVCQKQ